MIKLMSAILGLGFMSGCVSPVVSTGTRLPTSARNPYQAYVCRNAMTRAIDAVHYERINSGTPTPEQINALNPKILFVNSDLKLVVLDSERPSGSPCKCEGIAARANEGYYVDRALFINLPEKDKSALQSDVVVGSLTNEPTDDASRNQCDGYKFKNQ